MQFIYSVISLIILSFLTSFQEEREIDAILYTIKDNRFEKVLDEVIADARLHMDEMQCRDKFSIMFVPPHTDTITCFEINGNEISMKGHIHIEKVDYDEILIYCSHERYESDGILVYNDVLFDVSGDVMPEILQRTNLSKTIPIASHVTNLDDYYVWRYQYNSEDGFQKLHSPFD